MYFARFLQNCALFAAKQERKSLRRHKLGEKEGFDGTDGSL